MNKLAAFNPSYFLPALIAVADEPVQRRFLEFFAVTIPAEDTLLQKVLNANVVGARRPSSLD